MKKFINHFQNFTIAFKVIAASIPILLLLFISSCRKENLPEIVSESIKSSKHDVATLKNFYSKMAAINRDELDQRTGETYALNELTSLVSSSIGYQHSNVLGFRKDRYEFVDTITFDKPSGKFDEFEAAALFDLVGETAKDQAGKIATDTVYFLGVSITIISDSHGEYKAQVSGTYTGTQGNSSFSFGHGMPDDRFFEQQGDCDDETEQINGAAWYLTRWIKSQYGYISLNATYEYVDNIAWLQNARYPNDDYWDPGDATYYSHDFRVDLIADNTNDNILDGHLDCVTFCYFWDKVSSVDRAYGLCITPSDLTYYCGNTKSIIDSWIPQMNREKVMNFLATGRYKAEDPNGTEPGSHIMNAWTMSVKMCDIETSITPTPKQSIEEF